MFTEKMVKEAQEKAESNSTCINKTGKIRMHVHRKMVKEAQEKVLFE